MSILANVSLEKEIIGQSFEGREIYKLTYGHGPVKVLMWSQMHGNEATATMALCDIFNFLTQSKEPLLELFKERLTIHFVPMLNPDGAERFIRRTAQKIDMNRDALALVCPESRLLKSLQEQLKPDFSFNLHDQNVRYAAGHTPHQTAIAFLATAFDEQRNWSSNRLKAMQVIVGMNEALQAVIPQKVGRFSDEFEPRAFGDNIQKWGSSLILVESGGNGDDREKQYLRELHFALLLYALQNIASENYGHHKLEQYEAIPLNTTCLFDLLIKSVNYKGQTIDVGIFIEEENSNGAKNFVLQGHIEDIGDMSVYHGIKELDASGLTLQARDEFLEKLTDKTEEDQAFDLNKKANFALLKNDQPVYFVRNGELIPLH